MEICAELHPAGALPGSSEETPAARLEPHAECPSDLRVRVSPYDRRTKIALVLWWLARALLFRTSFHTWNGFRARLLRLFGADIGRGIVIGPTVHVTHPWNVTIGDHSQIGDYAWLYAIGPIRIERHAMVSQKAFLCTGGHDYTQPSMPLATGPIEIGSGAWVCADVFIGPGVAIGAGAVIGARSAVFRDMPSMMVCMGVPCRPVKPRNTPQGQS